MFLLFGCVAQVLCCVAGVSGALPSTIDSYIGADEAVDSLA